MILSSYVFDNGADTMRKFLKLRPAQEPGLHHQKGEQEGG